MSKLRTHAGSGASIAMILASSLLAVACGGGGSSPAPVVPAPGPGVIVLPDNPPPVNASGFVGSCSSLAGGSAAGYEVGFCNTRSKAGTVSEGTFQNRGVTGLESPGINQYVLNLPAEWGGTIPLLAGVANTTQFPSAIGGISGGYALDRILPQPATDSTSIVDFGSQVGLTGRLISFGLWGRSKLTDELFFGGFAGPTIGALATPSTYLGGPAATIAMNGTAVSWHLRTAQTIVPTTINPTQGLSAAAQFSVSLAPGGSTVTGTLSAFTVRSGGVAVSAGVNNVTFSGTLSNTTGQFVGTFTGGGTGNVKGALFGPTADQITGQFAGTGSDGRLLTGSFGAKR
jgi:hypothetical protein